MGTPITMGPDGINVPNDPIIPFIEGDGIGPDIWAATRTVLDAAVGKAYTGKAASNATLVFNLRIDADYKLSSGGFAPVKVTYLWEEGGIAKKDVHVAKQPQETYTITCGSAPVMKSISPRRSSGAS